MAFLSRAGSPEKSPPDTPRTSKECLPRWDAADRPWKEDPGKVPGRPLWAQMPELEPRRGPCASHHEPGPDSWLRSLLWAPVDGRGHGLFFSFVLLSPCLHSQNE